VETCLQDTFTFKFVPGGIEIEADNNSPFRFGTKEPITAKEI